MKTVGELRKLIAGLKDDVELCITLDTFEDKTLDGEVDEIEVDEDDEGNKVLVLAAVEIDLSSEEEEEKDDAPAASDAPAT